jgi:hypothetical protein
VIDALAWGIARDHNIEIALMHTKNRTQPLRLDLGESSLNQGRSEPISALLASPLRTLLGQKGPYTSFEIIATVGDPNQLISLQ